MTEEKWIDGLSLSLSLWENEVNVWKSKCCQTQLFGEGKKNPDTKCLTNAWINLGNELTVSIFKLYYHHSSEATGLWEGVIRDVFWFFLLGDRGCIFSECGKSCLWLSCIPNGFQPANSTPFTRCLGLRFPGALPNGFQSSGMSDGPWLGIFITTCFCIHYPWEANLPHYDVANQQREKGNWQAPSLSAKEEAGGHLFPMR